MAHDEPTAPLLAFFSSPIADPGAVDRSAAMVRAELERAGFAYQEVPGSRRAGPAPRALLIAVILTGGTEDQVLAWLGPGPRARLDTGPAGVSATTSEALLLTLPHSNSLPAALEVMARLDQEDRNGRVVMVGKEGWLDRLGLAVRIARLRTFLPRARIGLLGGPSSWLLASSPDVATVRRVWGPEVVTIPLQEVTEAYRKLSQGRSADQLFAAESLHRAAERVVEPEETTLSGSAILFEAIASVAEKHHLDALTIRCFDLLGELRNTGCVALARLNDRGVTAACEGDLPATLTMMVLGAIAGRPCFMANPSDFDSRKRTVTFAHCSVPFSLTASHRLRSHFESGIGVGIEGRLPGGEYTVARIGGRELDRSFSSTGTAVAAEEAPIRDDLCRTQLTLRLPDGGFRLLLKRPLGNHHILVPGDFAWDFDRFVMREVGTNASHRRESQAPPLPA